MSNNESRKSHSIVYTVSREVKALREMGLVFEPTMSLDEILTEIVDRTTRLIEAERSTLFLVEDDDTLVSRVIEGDEIKEIRLSPGQGLAGWACRFGRPLIVSDVYDDERFDPTWDRQTGFVTRSVICHPIIGHKGEVIGVVEALNKLNDDTFSESDHHLLGLITGQLALVIENSKLVLDLVQKNRALGKARQSLNARNAEVTLLLDFEQIVATAEDLDTLFYALLSKTLKATHTENCLIYRTDSNGAEIRHVRHDEPCTNIIRASANNGFPSWIARKTKELNVSDPITDPRYHLQEQEKLGLELRNIAGVPIMDIQNGSAQGALVVQNKVHGNSFDEDDMRLLRLIAEKLSQAISLFNEREARERDRRLATVGRLLAGVLHDIKSPMAVISGYAELLAQKTGDPEGQDYLDRLNKAVARISKMAEDIIAFSKGERDILVTKTMLTDFIDEFILQIEPLLEGRNISLKTQLRTAGIIKIDKEKMERVFQNIVINAVEAMTAGGTLTIEVDRMEDELVFAFTDTGPGIPDVIRGSIFQSFVTMGKRQGTGLGLAVAREIVSAHNGTISFSSIKNRGTTFLVSLPG